KCGSAGKCRRKLRLKFCHARVPNRQTIHNLVNRLETMGLLIDNEMTYVRLEHTPRKSLKCLARETGVSTPSARMAPQLLKLRPCKTAAIRSARSSQQGSFVQLVSTVFSSKLRSIHS
ncbi:hypothetical protein B7P43_G16572, partial [Cryptotermes secundus]